MSKAKLADAERESDLPIALLEDLIKQWYEALKKNASKEAKIGDWIKMIELYRKMAPENAAQKALWKDLEKIRQKVLGDRGAKRPAQLDSSSSRGGKKGSVKGA